MLQKFYKSTTLTITGYRYSNPKQTPECTSNTFKPLPRHSGKQPPQSTPHLYESPSLASAKTFALYARLAAGSRGADGACPPSSLSCSLL